MTTVRVRHRGVFVTLVGIEGQRAIILAYGLPGVPSSPKEPFVKKLVRAGFLVAIPHYLGTFDSTGKCTIENCVNTILYTIELMKSGAAKELIGMQEVTWHVNDIILAGGSFGGSVVLVAGAKSRTIKRILAFAPPTDYRTMGKSEYPEETIDEDFRIMKRLQPYTWRFTKHAWQRWESGTLDLNPVDYIAELSKKRVLLVHGARDTAVHVTRSQQLYARLKRTHPPGAVGIFILPRKGHVGVGVLDNRRVFARAMAWCNAKNGRFNAGALHQHKKYL